MSLEWIEWGHLCIVNIQGIHSKHNHYGEEGSPEVYPHVSQPPKNYVDESESSSPHH